MSLGEEYIRIQTCVLRVGVHCDGCRKTIEKRLKEIEGVYIVSMDPGLGKVQVKITMAADMSPQVLVKKLKKKSKKIAELIFSQPPNSGASLSAPAAVSAGEGISGSGRPQVLSSAPSPKSDPMVEDDDDDSDEDEDEIEHVDEDGEEDQEDDHLLAENVAPPPANVSNAPSKVASPKVNDGVNDGSSLSLQRSGSRKSNVPVNPTQLGGGPNMSDMAMAMRAAMTAARGGQSMGQFNPPYGLPPRPNNGPVNRSPRPNPNQTNQQRQEDQQLAPGIYHHHPAAPNGVYLMDFNQPQNCIPFQNQPFPPYAFPDQVQPRKESVNGYEYTFSDENTGSCTVM